MANCLKYIILPIFLVIYVNSRGLDFEEHYSWDLNIQLTGINSFRDIILISALDRRTVQSSCKLFLLRNGALEKSFDLGVGVIRDVCRTKWGIAILVVDVSVIGDQVVNKAKLYLLSEEQLTLNPLQLKGQTILNITSGINQSLIGYNKTQAYKFDGDRWNEIRIRSDLTILGIIELDHNKYVIVDEENIYIHDIELGLSENAPYQGVLAFLDYLEGVIVVSVEFGITRIYHICPEEYKISRPEVIENRVPVDFASDWEKGVLCLADSAIQSRKKWLVKLTSSGNCQISVDSEGIELLSQTDVMEIALFEKKIHYITWSGHLFEVLY